jgi:hypothetical protein
MVKQRFGKAQSQVRFLLRAPVDNEKQIIYIKQYALIVKWYNSGFVTRYPQFDSEWEHHGPLVIMGAQRLCTAWVGVRFPEGPPNSHGGDYEDTRRAQTSSPTNG